MSSKPIIFNIFCILFTIIALAFPIQIVLLYGHGISELNAIWNKLTILNLLCITILVFNAIASWRGSNTLLITLPLMVLAIAVNNYYVSKLGNDFSSSVTSVSTTLLLLATTSIVLTKGFDILFQQQNRWWMIPKRHQKTLPVFLKNQNQVTTIGETFDISTTGVFVSLKLTNDHLGIGQKIGLATGDLIDLVIPRMNKSDITCKGKIVRKTFSSAGKYGEGLGIQFTNINLYNQLLLRLA